MNGSFLKHPILGLLLLLPLAVLAAEAPVPNLEERISTFEAQREGKGPDARSRAVMEQAARDLAAAMPDPGLKVGSRAPDFTLPDAHGKPVRLADLLQEGPVIVTFYRGAWCPYCNLQLKALRESLPHLEAYGARLVAISPQTPDHSRAQVEKDDYPFHVLSDLDDSVMKAYNLYFELPEEVRALYKGNFDLDIEAYNGEGRHGLPVPGTFVLDQQGIVRAAFADTDYKKRMEPRVMIEALEAIQ
ncbi:MAG: AhpC/TSA family protein [Xanthomonadaceae bacterium]|nr:AhpC/TSA family protein [Xanthomonadaceae bacterium]